MERRRRLGPRRYQPHNYNVPGSLSSHLVLGVTNRISSLRYIIQDIVAADKASVDLGNPSWVNDTGLMLDGQECLLEADLIVSTAVKNQQHVAVGLGPVHEK